MPGRNDFVRLTEREWNATTETLAHCVTRLERLERENIEFKAKASVFMFIAGGVGSLIVAVIGHYWK